MKGNIFKHVKLIYVSVFESYFLTFWAKESSKMDNKILAAADIWDLDLPREKRNRQRLQKLSGLDKR